MITSRFPYGAKETFLTEELAQLSLWFDVLVVPASPTSEALAVPWLHDVAVRLRLGSPNVLKLAIAEALSHPISAIRAFASVVSAPRRFSARVKNAAVFPTALAAARMARRKRVGHIHAYWLSTPSTIAYVVSRLTGIPWSATGHRHDLVDSNVRTSGKSSAGFIPTAQFVRTISQQGAQQLQYATRADVPVHVIHLGVTLPRPRDRTSNDVLHLVCAANLEPVKGHESLFRALQLASREVELRATIVGDGTLRRELEARAAMLGLGELITFEGVVPHARLLERMDSGEFDAAILTSLDDGPAKREGIPVFLMEAMARGLPVVTTRSGAVDELVNDESGIVCSPGDSRALADAIKRLARDTALRFVLGNRGRRTIASAFDVEVTSRHLAMAIAPELEDALGRKSLSASGSRGRDEHVSLDSIEREPARIQST